MELPQYQHMKEVPQQKPESRNQISIDLPFYSKTASNGIISKPISSEKPILMPLRIYYKKGYMTPLIQQFIEKARAML